MRKTVETAGLETRLLRQLACVLSIGIRYADGIMASGPVAARTGRTHERHDPILQPSHFPLAGRVVHTRRGYQKRAGDAVARQLERVVIG